MVNLHILNNCPKFECYERNTDVRIRVLNLFTKNVKYGILLTKMTRGKQDKLIQCVNK